MLRYSCPNRFLAVKSALPGRDFSTRALVFLFALLGTRVVARGEQPYAIQWSRLIGGSDADLGGYSSFGSNGAVFVSGTTSGFLGDERYGENDAFLVRLAADGNSEWVRQFGSQHNDGGLVVSTGANGRLFTAGFTEGNIDGANQGKGDAFITSWDEMGNSVWSRQFGTPESDGIRDLAVDESNAVVVVGTTYGALAAPHSSPDFDAYIRKYAANGDLEWQTQFGGRGGDEAFNVDIDRDGNIYVSGDTHGDSSVIPDPLIYGSFIRKYSPSGTLQWSREFREASERFGAHVALAEDGSLYLVHHTVTYSPDFQTYDITAILTKLANDGSDDWSRALNSEVGTPIDIQVDPFGSVFIGGFVGNDAAEAGFYDATLTKVSADGVLRWTTRLEAAGDLELANIDIDGQGNVLLSGNTLPPGAGRDVFVAKFAVPEPSGFVLLIVSTVTATALSLSRLRRT